MAVLFHTHDIDFSLDKKTKLKEWIEQVINFYSFTYSDLSVIFCSDDYLLSINNKYLNRDYLTDVITFDYTSESCISGDIFISIDRVKENAIDYSNSFEEELYRIIIHGVLHLIGFMDDSPESKEKMRAAENDCLSMLTF